MVADRYKIKLMGDCLELMPLDLFLFVDLIEKVAWPVIATTPLHKEGNPYYSMDTPSNAWATRMVAGWELLSKHRIVADIQQFQMALEAILSADGSYVNNHNLCNEQRKTMHRLVHRGVVHERDASGAKINLGEDLAQFFDSRKGIAAIKTSHGLKKGFFALSFVHCLYIKLYLFSITYISKYVKLHH